MPGSPLSPVPAGSAPPVALTIAGSDSSGGAGIQADLKTFTALGCFGATALTAITAQNTTGVRAATLLETDLITQQIGAVAEDLPVAATKTGMLGSAAVVEAVAEAVERHGLRPLVVDPVMVAKSGDPLIDEDAVQAVIDRLLPLASVVTPNRQEAARLTGCTHEIETVEAAAAVADRLCRRLGAQACVVKGIERDRDGRAEVVDVFFDGEHIHELTHRRYATNHTHGSGCAFAAAVTAGLAHGRPLAEALATAAALIERAIASELRLGHGTSPVDPAAWTRE